MSSTANPVDLLQHPLLTTIGLCVETHTGLVRAVEQRLAAECGLSEHWFEVLLRLARSPGEQLRMTDLAAQTSLTASGLTRSVDRLEEEGLVRRVASPTDRRGILAVLTPKGQQRIMDALVVHVDHAEELIGTVFSTEEIELFTGLVRRLRDSINPAAAQASAPGGLSP